MHAVDDGKRPPEQVEAATPVLTDDELVHLAAFSFVPEHARHHFSKSLSDDDADESEAIRRARQVRSAWLVSRAVFDLLDDGGSTTKGPKAKDPHAQTKGHLSPTRRKPRQAQPRRGPKPSSTLTTATEPAAAATIASAVRPPPPAVEHRPSQLYSHAIEQSLTWRMTLTRARADLVAYVDALHATVAGLEAVDGPVLDNDGPGPAWIWAPSTAASGRLPTLLQLQRRVLQVVTGCLPDCDVYLAMYDATPLADPTTASPLLRLRYVAASRQSRMLGRELLRRDGDPPTMSFTVLESLTPVVIPDVQHVGAAELRRFERLQRDSTVDMATAAVPTTGPFVCLPLAFGDSASSGIGVLGVDACRRARQQRPEALSPSVLGAFLRRMHLPDAASEFARLGLGGREWLALTATELQHKPAFRGLRPATKKRLLELAALLRAGHPLHLESSSSGTASSSSSTNFVHDDEVLGLLDDVCERAGPFLDEYRRRVHWPRVLGQQTRDPTTTVLDVYALLVQAIADALVRRIERVSIWRIDASAKVKDDPGGGSVAAIATTHLPDERLLPFLHWQERQIRRLALYKEPSSDDGGAGPGGVLSQGAITRITLPPPPKGNNEVDDDGDEDDENDIGGGAGDGGGRHVCTRATYHVAWGNRTQQSLSWRELRLVLAVRPMNARHYQLQRLLQRLQKLTPDERRRRWLRMSDPHALIHLLPVHDHGPNDQDDESATMYHVLQVDLATASSAITSSEAHSTDEPDVAAVERFVQRAVAITRANLRCVRGRAVRAFRRQLSTVKTTRQFNALSLTPSAEAPRALAEIVGAILAEIAANLPGTASQVTELSPDGSELVETFVGHPESLPRSPSSLTTIRLARGQRAGVMAFRCVDTRQSIVVHADDDTDHARTPPPRPWVLLPLIHEDCVVGVLRVADFARVPKGRDDERHPEAGVVEYLSSLTRPLATAIYVKRRAFALYELQSLRHEPVVSVPQLLLAAATALQSVMRGVWKTRVVEVDFARAMTTTLLELSEAERRRAATGLYSRVVAVGLRQPELRRETLAKHWHLTSDAVDELFDAWGDHEATERALRSEYENYFAQIENPSLTTTIKTDWKPSQRRQFADRRVRDRYFSLHLDDQDRRPNADLRSPAIRHAKVAAEVEMATRARATSPTFVAHALGAALSSQTILFAPVPVFTRHGSGSAGPSSMTTAVYVAVAMTHRATCEQTYVTRVAESLSQLLEALHRRVERCRLRQQIVETFRAEVATNVEALVAQQREVDASKPGTRGLSPTEERRLEALEDLQARAVRHIAHALHDNPNVYIGLHEPARRRLRYTAATDKSNMRNKHLHRGHGLSFFVLDHQTPLILTAATREDVERRCSTGTSGSGHTALTLRCFSTTPPKWPVVLVPLGHHGVLGLDDLERYGRLTDEPQSQPELGIVDFVQHMADILADALTRVRAATAEQRHRRREAALLRVLAVCDDQTTPPLALEHIVLEALEQALTGIDAYIGLVQPLCAGLTFTSATRRSRMAGQRHRITVGTDGDRTETDDGVSFRVFVTQRACVIPELEHSPPEFLARLRWSSATGSSGAKGPWVCVPIPFVGVLAVDSFTGAAGGDYGSALPEPEAVSLIETLANHLGAHIRQHRADAARRAIPGLFTGDRSTLATVLDAVFGLIAANVVGAIDLRVLRFTADAECALVRPDEPPLALARSPTLDAADKNPWPDQEGLEGIRAWLQAERGAASRVLTLARHPEVLVLRCCATREVERDDAALRTTAIVVRRVHGAAWMYDAEFLEALAPELDALLERVNRRIVGIVARRVALARLQARCQLLEEEDDHEAAQGGKALPSRLERLALFLNDAVQTVAAAIEGDAYLGERSLDGSRLRYIAASQASEMRDVELDLLHPANVPLPTVQLLVSSAVAAEDLAMTVAKTAAAAETHETRVVHLPPDANGVEAAGLRQLTSKRPQRVFVVLRIDDVRILGVDSLSPETFVAVAPKTTTGATGVGVAPRRPHRHQAKKLEPGVLTFLQQCAAVLATAIVTTRCRDAYDALSELKRRRHANPRAFFALVHELLRRELGASLHSQQILHLADDFTGSYAVQSWHAAPTRRPIVAAPVHFCSLNGCQRRLLQAADVHFETHLRLPMTNLPRALDASRGRLEPRLGRERRGDFACDCLATMLDAATATPRLALCAFSRSREDNAGVEVLPTHFTRWHRQFFFALAAVAADVYAHVHRACVLETLAVEQLHHLRELLGAKDGLVVEGRPPVGADKDRDDSSEELVIRITSSLQPQKHPRGGELRGSRATAIGRLLGAATGAGSELVVAQMTTRQVPIPEAPQTTRTTTSTANATPVISTTTEQTKDKAKRGGFLRRPNFLSRHKPQTSDPSASAAPGATPGPVAMQSVVDFHVIVRGYHPTEALSLRVERPLPPHGATTTAPSASVVVAAAAAAEIEAEVRAFLRHSQALIDEFSRRRQGDEDYSGAGHGVNADLGEGGGGGGWYLLATWRRTRDALQRTIGPFEAELRHILTGVEPTARREPGPSSLPSAPPATTATVLGGPKALSPVDLERRQTAMLPLLRAAMLLCGVKKEFPPTAAAPTEQDAELLKEFLRVHAGRRLVEDVDPRDLHRWPAIQRAVSHLRTQHGTMRVATAMTTNTAAGDPHKDAIVAGVAALRAFLAAVVAAMRYFRGLVEDAKRRRVEVEAVATVLQCGYRRVRAWRLLQRLRRERAAAVRVQCRYRQRLARRRLLYLRWTKAAVTIQRMYRRKLAARRGRRPKLLTGELRALADRFGSMQATPLRTGPSEIEDLGTWKVDMAAFDSFKAYLASPAGREAQRREERVLAERFAQVSKQREQQLDAPNRLLAEAHDVFELLDVEGSGELSRERTRELLTRLHVPLNAAEADDVLGMMDSDGSGAISFVEFSQWFTHEYPVLRRRNRDCGVLSKRDRQWMVEESARSALRKRWRATQQGHGHGSPGEAASDGGGGGGGGDSPE